MVVSRRRVRRTWAVLAVAGLGAASCSGSSDPVPAPVATAVPGPTIEDGEPATQPDSGEIVDDGAAPVGGDALIVSMSVEAPTLDVDGAIGVEIDPAEVAELDPFGRFASCSGLRQSVGAYSVLVSEPEGPISSASVLTIGRVAGPGIHQADVRIERRGGEPVVATGTVALDAGLRSGSFVAFDSGGDRVAGSFSCDGSQGSPVPLEAGADDGVVDTVEVFVLLRRDGDERVVGLAVANGSATEVRCPGAEGSTNDVLVRVDGGLAVGALTTFELGDGDAAAMRMRAGGESYEFDEVAVLVDDDRTSGTFSASGGDGLTADGAFSCT